MKKITALFFTTATIMCACTSPSDKEPILTRAPDSYSSFSASELEDRAEQAYVSYTINARSDNWDEAAKSLAEAVRSYNSIHRFHPLSPEAKEHQDKLRMEYDGSEVKLDALLQEGGPGSVIKIGDYEVNMIEKQDRSEIGGKPSDYTAEISLRYKGDQQDINPSPYSENKWVNITADDIYLSELVDEIQK